MRIGEPGPSKTSQYGVDGTEGTEAPLVEADSSAIEVYRGSSSAPEQMRSEPRDLAGPSSIGVDRGAPRCEGHEARSANEPWPVHQSWVHELQTEGEQLRRATDFGHDLELEAGEPSSLEGGLDERDFDVGGTLHLEGDPARGTPLAKRRRNEPRGVALIEMARTAATAELPADVWREVTINNLGGRNVVLPPGCGELGQQSRPCVEHMNLSKYAPEREGREQMPSEPRYSSIHKLRTEVEQRLDNLLDSFREYAVKRTWLKRKYATSLVGAIRKFSTWLQDQKKPSIIGRLDDDPRALNIAARMDEVLQLYKVHNTPYWLFYRARRGLDLLGSFLQGTEQMRSEPRYSSIHKPRTEVGQRLDNLLDLNRPGFAGGHLV